MSFYPHQMNPYRWNGPQTFGSGARQGSYPGNPIYYGSQGQPVAAVQQRLKQLGYDIGPVDGIFGLRTLAAVKAFQSAQGLAADGIVGPDTWQALFGGPQPPPSPKPYPGYLIRYGSRGQPVADIQQKLKQMGYDIGSVDGIFGQKTLAAVKAFQKAQGLPVDGIVGPNTWQALFGGPQPPPSPKPYPGYLISYGSQGSYVADIQQRLKQMGYNVGSVDGIFGQKTMAAVKAFQKAQGLAVDGIVGAKTWDALFSNMST